MTLSKTEFETRLKRCTSIADPSARKMMMDDLRSAEVIDENGNPLSVAFIETDSSPVNLQAEVEKYIKAANKPVYKHGGNTPFAPNIDTDFTPSRQSKVFKDTRIAKALGEWFVGAHRKTHSTFSDTAGGFLVPDELASEIINLANTFGAIRRNARNWSMSSDTLKVPRVTGRPSTYWVGEGNDITASDAAFDQIGLTARKLAAISIVTSELFEDSVVSIGDFLGQEMARQIGYAEDNAGINGDGTSTYGGIDGIINRLSTLNGTDDGGGLTLASGNAYSEVTIGDLTKLTGRLPSYARAGAKWFCSPTVADAILLRLVMSAGGATGADITNGVANRSFLGYPVELIETMPTTEANSQIPLLFGNMAQAVSFGDRRQLRVETFNSGTVGSVNLVTADCVAVRATERLDINAHDLGTSSAAGPLMGLILAGA